MDLKRLQETYEQRMQQAVDEFDQAFCASLSRFNEQLAALVAQYNIKARRIGAAVLADAEKVSPDGVAGGAIIEAFKAELREPETIQAPALTREQVFESLARESGATDILREIDQQREQGSAPARAASPPPPPPSAVAPAAAPGVSTGEPAQPPPAPDPAGRDRRNLEIMCRQLEQEVESLKRDLAAAGEEGGRRFLREALDRFSLPEAGELFATFSSVKSRLEALASSDPVAKELADLFDRRMEKFFAAFGLSWNRAYPIGKKLKIRSAHLGQYDYAGDDFREGETKVVTVSDLEWRSGGKIVRKARVTEVRGKG
ncbi:MAG: hypothetical protein HY719_10925 [Planctomycetes bacterium]|nr:hypothetical protein [Planctomycetota bacterium]